MSEYETKEFRVFCLTTDIESIKKWKTYKGALRNCKGPTDITSGPEGVGWIRRHPDWCAERIESTKITNEEA